MFDSHAHPGVLTSNALVCTPTTRDKEKILSFPFRSLGALPGFISDISEIEDWAKKERFLGEVGLDSRFPDKRKQIDFLNSILTIAKENNNYVTLHGVGWTDEIMRILKEYKGVKLLIHGFTGSLETAVRMMDSGAVISISPRAERTRNFTKLITSLPYFLTESDMETGEEETHTLKEWNDRLSLYLNRDIAKESEELFFSFFS